MSYGSNPAFPQITYGNAFGFNLPDPEAVAGLLWSEYRGLFFWSPVLLMAIPGLVILFRKHPPVAWMITIVLAFILLQVSSFYSWFGGNAVGPRYLAPSLPFLGLAAAYGIKRFPIPGIALALAVDSVDGDGLGRGDRSAGGCADAARGRSTSSAFATPGLPRTSARYSVRM